MYLSESPDDLTNGTKSPTSSNGIENEYLIHQVKLFKCTTRKTGIAGYGGIDGVEVFQDELSAVPLELRLG